MEKRFDSVIYNCLLAYAKKSDWNAMLEYINGLNNSAFRVSSYILSDRLLATLNNTAYWQCFSVVALSNTKAFLVTFLKAAVVGYKNNVISFDSAQFIAFAKVCQEAEKSIDRHKTLQIILPVLKTYSEVDNILATFCGTNTDRKLQYLCAFAESKPCYFEIFMLFRQSDISTTKMVEYLRGILKRTTALSYNFVSIMKSYFGIEGLNGIFSLKIEPYEYSRIEKDYDKFVSVLERI